jgi:predicted Zn-ribbon and HTH transcriptional regulator
MAVYRARRSFVTTVDGRRRSVRTGDLISGTDPVRDGREHLFQNVEEAVETATQAPGEKRELQPAVCDVCGFEAKSPVGLASHRRTHQDDE